MKKENDDINDLFRSRLSNAEMDVRDGFWEELSQDIPVAFKHRRRLLFVRIAAAASVLLVLAASSATFRYFFPKEEIEEAFAQVNYKTDGKLFGDQVYSDPVPASSEPTTSKPTPASVSLFANQLEEDEESGYFSFSMSFSFSSSSSDNGENRLEKQANNAFQQAITNDENMAITSEERYTNVPSVSIKKAKDRLWALKAQIGSALPADDGYYKMPINAGVTVERKLTDRLGIETGIVYSNLRSKAQHLHYLGIPLRLNVTMLKARKIDLYATIGGIADKCIAGAPNNSFKEEPIQLAATAGVGINYKINERLAVFAEPGISHHFKTDSKLATIRSERPTNFNFLCGLRMTY